jgi:hypothetical protein
MRKAWWIALTMTAAALGTQTGRAQEPANRPAAPATATVPTQSTPIQQPYAVPVQPGPALAPYGALVQNHYAAGCGACSAWNTGSTCNGCSPCGQQRAFFNRQPACSSCQANNCSTCNGCNNCGKRQEKIARLLDFLIYIPADRGKTKCCQICQSTPPPAWVFFPCQGCGNGCATCAGGTPAAVSYAKTPTAPGPNPVAQAAYVPPTPLQQRLAAPVQQAAAPVQQAAAPIQQQQATAAPQPPPPPPTKSSYNQLTPQGKVPVLDPAQFRKMPN